MKNSVKQRMKYQVLSILSIFEILLFFLIKIPNKNSNFYFFFIFYTRPFDISYINKNNISSRSI